MKKRALTKDFFREIKNTFNRFASILLIVALGVAFFSGVRASKPDMWLSGDALYDAQNMMDIRVLSTLGLTSEDLEAIRKIDGVKEAEGINTLEVLSEKDSYQNVIKLISAPESVNQIKVTKGRMPEKEDEILVDVTVLNHGYKIGDTIEVLSGTKDDISDSLKVTSFTIVGAGTESYYISLTRGTSSIGTGSLTGFGIVMPSVFVKEIYTEIDLTIDGAAQMMCYSDEYRNYIDTFVEKIEAIADERCEIRYNSVIGESNDKINDGQKEIDDAKKKLSDAKKELDDGKRKLSDAKAELVENEEKLQSGKAEIANKRKELNDNKVTAVNSLTQAQAQKQQIEAALSGLTPGSPMYNQMMGNLAAVNAGIDQIEAGLSQIESGFTILNEKEAELIDGEAKLLEGKAELEKQESKLNSGIAEYNSEKEKADTEILDGEKELEDARNKLNDIKKPTWYVLDREYLQTVVEYGQDAERIGNIGKVFPLVFFIVAALVSLTTMTRMVEEQRMQIGTLKALGYSKWDVAKKYIYYALFASLIGSIIGVVFGQWLFPTVIIRAYRILYVNIVNVLTPMDLFYTVSSALAAILCTVAATLFACVKELRSVPASLMRPEAPKGGKRILLERITPFWKRLNFTSKATFRNIFRYKKRFFMTIFGIGGCMALILVGYGVKDSIVCIGTRQFGEVFVYQSAITKNKDAKEDEIDKLYQQIASDKEITNSLDAYETSIDAAKGSTTKSGYLIVPKDTSKLDDFIHLRDRLNHEKYTLDDEGVVISEKLSTLLGVKKGDTITLKDGDTSQVEVTVSDITETYFMHYIYMSPGLYEKIYDSVPEYNIIYTTNTDTSKDFEKALGERYLDLEGVNGVEFISSTADNVAKMLKSMDIITYVLIISAGLLAFVVLYNLNNINITERRRELATIKVLGFYNSETAMYIYRENVFLTIFGVIIGVFMGIVLHRFVILTAEIDLLMFAREIMPRSYVLSIVFTLAFSVLINGVMYFQLKKINMVESLKSVE